MSSDLVLNDTDLALLIARELQDHGVSSTYQRLVSLDWIREPVDPYTFLFDDYYLGAYGKSLYSKWVDVLLEVLDPDKSYSEVIFSGAIGTGKSTCAAVCLAYKLYRLSCLIDPCQFYGLMSGSPIVFGIYNVYKYKADDNYTTLSVFINNTQYFVDYFPTLKMKRASARSGLVFDNRISVITGANELHALGNNVFSMVLDEMNFMKGSGTEGSPSQARDLYTAAKRRLESRFMYKGNIPGLMILISSRNTDTSWLEKHLAEVRERDNVYVADYSIWEVKRSIMGYSGKRFVIDTGDQFHGARILDDTHIPDILEDESEPDYIDRVKSTPAISKLDNRELVFVPVEHRTEFESDIDGALRDLGGCANLTFSPLIRYRDHINACIDTTMFHPFAKESFPLSDEDDIKISQYLANPQSLINIKFSSASPKINPSAARHIHIDLAETSDSCGMSMGHVSKIYGTRPHITMDFMIRILAPRAGMIDFSKLRDFIVYLRDKLGYPIKSISFDSYQSTDSRQILKKLKFDTLKISVDRDDTAYKTLRSTIYEHRMTFYEYKPFIEELVSLQHHVGKRKVDHPHMGSKDVSDSVAAVVYYLTDSIGDDPSLSSYEDSQMTPEYDTPEEIDSHRLQKLIL